MTTRPTVELRRQVVERASNCCEYCLLHQNLAASTHQVDHVIAEKHRGQALLDNLALSCTVCNGSKATRTHSTDPETGEEALLFNPRRQVWSEHLMPATFPPGSHELAGHGARGSDPSSPSALLAEELPTEGPAIGRVGECRGGYPPATPRFLAEGLGDDSLSEAAHPLP